MKVRIIDTNIILRFLIGDVSDQLEKSKKLIERVEKREEKVYLPLLCAFEVVFTLEKFYQIPRAEIEEKLSILFSLKGIQLPSKNIFLKSLKLYKKTNISFTDAFVITLMKDTGIDEIYSFDNDFEKIEGIKRFDP
ncbi:MAG TPA: PIN domain-containing protein [bacterium]|nr:PIN domain-containing protein [bacterium]